MGLTDVRPACNKDDRHLLVFGGGDDGGHQGTALNLLWAIATWVSSPSVGGNHNGWTGRTCRTIPVMFVNC